jgi:hypothetical protein
VTDNYKQNMKGQYLISGSPEQLCLYHFIDAPQDVKGGDFRSQHPYAAAALSVTLIGVGAAVVLPAATVLVLGAIGFGPGGVAAGRYFLYYSKNPLLVTC